VWKECPSGSYTELKTLEIPGTGTIWTTGVGKESYVPIADVATDRRTMGCEERLLHKLLKEREDA
jgi:hypothetical protein